MRWTTTPDEGDGAAEDAEAESELSHRMARRVSARDAMDRSSRRDITNEMAAAYSSAVHRAGRAPGDAGDALQGAAYAFGDAVVGGVAAGGLRLAGNLRVLHPLLDLFFEDLDPRTVRLDERGLEIHGPSKFRQTTLVALLNGCSPWTDIEFGPLRIDVPLDEIAARAGFTPTHAAFTSISLTRLPFPDLLPYDEVLRIQKRVYDEDASLRNILEDDYEKDLTPEQRRKHRRRLQELRHNLRDDVQIAELRHRNPRVARLLDFLEGALFIFFLFITTLISVYFNQFQTSTERHVSKDKSVRWFVQVQVLGMIIVIIYCLDILVRIWCYKRLRPRGGKQFFESNLNRLEVAVGAPTKRHGAFKMHVVEIRIRTELLRRRSSSPSRRSSSSWASRTTARRTARATTSRGATCSRG